LKELSIPPKFSHLGTADTGPTQFLGEPIEQLVAVRGSVLAVLFKFDNIEPDQPVPNGQADVDGPRCVAGQSPIDEFDGAEQFGEL
jgi:hypothetical protein